MLTKEMKQGITLNTGVPLTHSQVLAGLRLLLLLLLLLLLCLCIRQGPVLALHAVGGAEGTLTRAAGGVAGALAERPGQRVVLCIHDMVWDGSKQQEGQQWR
jgi:hypothetical protein